MNTDQVAARPTPPAEDWNNWQWQMRNRIDTVERLRSWIDVTPDEEEAIRKSAGRFRWTITPYYASLMRKDDPACPIRRQAVPSLNEFETYAGADVDPVGDREYRKTNRVVHKYPDRVMMLITKACPVYCRHCTRKYHTTDIHGSYFAQGEAESFDDDFQYIADHPEIRDVLISGGDPLMYSDEKLEHILSNLRSISHVEILRIGTRFPVLLPMRITEAFGNMLEKYHPLWLNTHFNHVNEITESSAKACDTLIRHGIPVQNQSVLLKGVNDRLDTMKDLLTGLLKIRVRPYYLYHCDNVTGVSHFVTSVDIGRDIMAGLLGQTTGFAIPQYVVTTRLGKVPICRDYVESGDDGHWIEGYQGDKIHLRHL